MTPEHHAEAILRAAGSSLRHYEARTREAILAAVREAVEAKWRDVAIKLHQALVMYTSEGCPYCSGDCGSANPPVFNCPTKIAAEAYRAFDALPTPPRGE